ncbi:UNVERIFIED_CONTAM: Inorganic phosphate transporter 2-1, chloroplastic [Sesamum calycinum]|uniref:Phosphate transporter n=1 Tax=Sesamum calycinum TaxID=2727403 RepID=A0AAW2QWD6_9LAMI
MVLHALSLLCPLLRKLKVDMLKMLSQPKIIIIIIIVKKTPILMGNSIGIAAKFYSLFFDLQGGIILWLACLDYTLYRGIHGRIRSGLWRTWSCLLELTGKVCLQCSKPGQAAAAAAPIAVFLGVTGISFAAFPLSKTVHIALAQALAYGTAGAVLVDRIIRKQLGHLLVKSASSDPEPKGEAHNVKSIGFLSNIAGPTGTQLEIVYGVFGYMQILSACFMSFAHGGNDVSNAIGPLAAALSILQGGMSGAEIVIPNDVLAWGGFGIVAGLMMWGYRVIATIGKKITELTPTRGFAAEFAAASVVLVASKLGLPISGTHTLVGAVMGVGFARGLNSVRAETVAEIVTSWVVTIPAGAMFSVVYTWILTKLLPGML